MRLFQGCVIDTVTAFQETKCKSEYNHANRYAIFFFFCGWKCYVMKVLVCCDVMEVVSVVI